MSKSKMQEAWIKAGLNPDNYSAAVADAMRIYAQPLTDMLVKIHKIEDESFGLKAFDVRRLKSEVQSALNEVT